MSLNDAVWILASKISFLKLTHISVSAEIQVEYKIAAKTMQRSRDKSDIVLWIITIAEFSHVTYCWLGQKRMVDFRQRMTRMEDALSNRVAAMDKKY